MFMNKRWKIQKGQSKSDYSEKSATQGTQDEEKQNKNKCLGHHYTQTNTKNANKTRALLQTSGGKDEPNIVCIRKSGRMLLFHC